METGQRLLTREGYQRMEQELNHLSTVRRAEIARRLRQTLPDGDILENAGLQDVRNDQAFLEGRIETLKQIMMHAVIIDDLGPRDRVGVGGYVTIVELPGDGTSETYRVLGSAEADPIAGSISNESPLGRALVGRGVGEEVVVEAPEGNLVFRIVGVN